MEWQFQDLTLQWDIKLTEWLQTKALENHFCWVKVTMTFTASLINRQPLCESDRGGFNPATAGWEL